MDEYNLRVSNRELFYSAMLLWQSQLVNVEYDFPADSAARKAELEEVKRSLHKKKLLRENSKGAVTLDSKLSSCVGFCAAPDSCVVADEDGFYATIYGVGDSCMLLERIEDGENEVSWFKDRQSADSYITERIEKDTTKEETMSVSD
jgi:hypothetical protein